MADPGTRDFVAAAAVPGHPGAYVLGCYDSRITLYSQQVRALEFAHALLVEHRVSATTHAAVIGGGAGGVAMAAPLALQGAASVHLFERASELMPLQSSARRRRLDPNIYGWPDAGSENEEAELPILDWRSGSAFEVRDALLQEFGEIGNVVRDRLVVRASHRVTGISSDGASFRVEFERDGAAGGSDPGSEPVDLVVLAIGFGLEPARTQGGADPELLA